MQLACDVIPRGGPGSTPGLLPERLRAEVMRKDIGADGKESRKSGGAKGVKVAEQD